MHIPESHAQLRRGFGTSVPFISPWSRYGSETTAISTLETRQSCRKKFVSLWLDRAIYGNWQHTGSSHNLPAQVVSHEDILHVIIGLGKRPLCDESGWDSDCGWSTSESVSGLFRFHFQSPFPVSISIFISGFPYARGNVQYWSCSKIPLSYILVEACVVGYIYV